MDNTCQETSRCGHIAIVGRPNVGKSTLINHILGQKLSITSRRPQTTRYQIRGVKTVNNVQAVYVDTPGIHKVNSNMMSRQMNKAALTSMKDVDLIIFMVDRNRWTEEDDIVFKEISEVESPVILVVNKIDRVAKKATILGWLTDLSSKKNFVHVVPLSAKVKTDVAHLELLVSELLPENQHCYDEDTLTDKSSRFFAAELIREKLMRQLGDEIPYKAAVEIEEFKKESRVLFVSACIWVERNGQKKIIIGQKGSRIKLIGQEARTDMEVLFGSKVMLSLWVKVKSGWSDDIRHLTSLGLLDKV